MTAPRTGLLAGKAALITGAARGIGRTCATAFAREGADVLLLDAAGPVAGVPYRSGSASQLDHTAALCRDLGATVLVRQADIRDPGALRDAAREAHQRFGRIDVLVNNAGIAAPSGRAVHQYDEDEWEVMLDINLTGTWRGIRAVADYMTRQRGGSIVNVASTAGLVGYRHFAGYVASKHGVVGLTKAAALDLAPLGIRVNALCPGSVRDAPEAEGLMLSEIARALEIPVAEHEATFVRDQPTNELVEPDSIAEAAVWLASDRSRQMTGSVLTVDGGFTSR
ncbi:SDR family oxidoreductase [Streptomyces fuscichromogenes]|uniref:3-ketoacyl-ACP reductase n=1 Tax=Streptomyces fuscichromogenes TaxID=1324013 RepID=A0A917XNW8_9ACTN|nr:SDR family oxidoreductase [Streptomyces fuscichromogenes]GGN42440.1 3-ketoacyl-ACP reductase [Streptomyces fuscichromogenes]